MLAAFILSCMIYQTKAQLIADNAIQIYPYNAQIAAQSDETPETVETPAASNKHLWGVATITHYCNCSICCGQWAGGGTASGTTPTAGRTVAADLPFGTRLLINGHEYIVEDRGVSGLWVDIYVNSHQEALDRGMYQTEVWIIDG